MGGARAGLVKDSDDVDELEELSRKVASAQLPDHARTTAEKELKVKMNGVSCFGGKIEFLYCIEIEVSPNSVP